MTVCKIRTVIIFMGLCCYLPTSNAAITCVVNKITGQIESGVVGKIASPECNLQNPVNILASLITRQEIEDSEGTKVIGGTIITNAPKLSDMMASLSYTTKIGQSSAEPAETKKIIEVHQQQPIKELSSGPKADDPTQKWEVLASDVRLANTFERWAQKAGWKVSWDASKHFLIDGSSIFTGTFEDAIKQVLMTPGIRLGTYPLEACIYGNIPPLIRITRQGEQTQECPD